MAIVLTNDENYKAIANAIRGQTGEIDKLLPEQMAEEIDNIPNYAQSVVQEVSDARTGYSGKRYNNLDARIDGDINDLLDKTNVVNYKDTTIHANNTYARNLVANRNKIEVLGQTIQNCLDHSSADKFSTLDGTIDEEGYIVLTADGSYKNFFSKIESAILKSSTTYTFLIDVKENSLVGDKQIRFGETSVYQPSSFTEGVFKTIDGTGIYKFTMQTKTSLDSIKVCDRAYLGSDSTSGTFKFRYAIVEGDWTNKEISWVPFGLNYPQTTEVVEDNGLEPTDENYQKRVININKPLASVSDTIRDRYYVKDGKKYHDQVVKEIILKGNEELFLVATTDNVTKAKYNTGVQIASHSVVCNRLNAIPSVAYSDIEGVATNEIGDIYFSIANSKLESPDINGIKKYIQANNLQFLIELVTPITTEIETEDMQSFDGQTNITTTNTIKPTLDIDIPSDLTAVTSSLIAENMALKQENQVLSNELESQASSIETQKANMDYISMMTGVEL